MECSCIRRSGTKFDFYLDLLDCDTLVFTDLSNWMDEDYYVIPDEWPMTIKFPDGNTKQVNFKPKGTTIFTSSSLGVGCLLDGIYCFSTESCGYDYHRNEAILCSLECKLDTLINQLDISYLSKHYPQTNPTLELIKNATTYMNSIRINARNGKVNQALKYFKLVSTELENIECL